MAWIEAVAVKAGKTDYAHDIFWGSLFFLGFRVDRSSSGGMGLFFAAKRRHDQTNL